jgi:hypothetical protein
MSQWEGLLVRWEVYPGVVQSQSDLTCLQQETGWGGRKIKSYLSHAQNTIGVDLTVKCLLYNPLNNNAVQEIELRKYLEACLVECCRDGCPSGRFSHLHSRTLELCQWPSGSWSSCWPRPFSPIAHFAWADSSRKSIGGSKLFQFKNGHCVPGELQCCRNALVPFPKSVPRHNPASELYRQFLWPHGLVFALITVGLI